MIRNKYLVCLKWKRTSTASDHLFLFPFKSSVGEHFGCNNFTDQMALKFSFTRLVSIAVVWKLNIWQIFLTPCIFFLKYPIQIKQALRFKKQKFRRPTWDAGRRKLKVIEINNKKALWLYVFIILIIVNMIVVTKHLWNLDVQNILRECRTVLHI